MGGKGEAAAAKSVPEPAELFYVDDDSVRKYALLIGILLLQRVA